MATRKPISLKKGENPEGQLWPDEPDRFTEDHVDKLLSWCVGQGASDVTIQTDRPVYNDISGKLYPATFRPVDSGDMAIFLSKIYGAEAQARLASGKDLDLSYEIRPDRYSRMRFRVNITAILSKGRDAAQITMRTLPTEPPTLEALGIEADIIKHVAPRQGMVVITGPTGSGKTTLLAAVNRMLLEQPNGCGKMLTYEAPIEFTYDTIQSPHSVVSQTEIGRHLDSFAHGVRNALRRKPNIILIGEARDKETISAAIEAGQTGHAVYTTTHTTGVATTIRRMISTFDPDERLERAYALMETLRMIVTQALVPKIGGGRIGVREWMHFDDAVREKLLDMDFQDWTNEVQRMMPNYGQTMAQSASKAFEAGLIEKRHYLMLSNIS
jgi:defect-in-organelle-trafficking protein DotB